MDPVRPAPDAIRCAVREIRRGKVVAALTDTIYGLLADARREGALRAVFRAKSRPATKPILLLLDSRARVWRVARDAPPEFEILANAFWPGPLTMVLPARRSLPRIVTAGLGTVAVRVPASPLVRMLSRRASSPLSGTSANLSGRQGARSADEVERQLRGRIPLILDSGRVSRTAPSTILDLARGRPRILREGAVSSARINKVLRGAARSTPSAAPLV